MSANKASERDAAIQDLLRMRLAIDDLLERRVRLATATFDKEQAGEKIRKAYEHYADCMVQWHTDVMDLVDKYGRIDEFDLKSPELLAAGRNCILHAGSAQIQ